MMNSQGKDRTVNPMPSDSDLIETATLWILQLEENNSRENNAAFVEWLQRNPLHLDAYMRAYKRYRLCDGLDRARRIDVDALIASIPRDVLPHRSLWTRITRSSATANDGGPRRTPMMRGLAATLAAILVIAALALSQQLFGLQSYETRVGEQREIKLDDGSIIVLNTRSRVDVDYSDTLRMIYLRDGEAMFTVKHDATRPFRVISGDTTIQAVGTQFAVYKRGKDTTVTVTEGSVAIAPDRTVVEQLPAQGLVPIEGPGSADIALPRLEAGEQAAVTSGQVRKVREPDAIDRSIAWRQRELLFRDSDLSFVASEFNRYNTLQLQVVGDIEKLRISGRFDADYPQALILYLQRDGSVEVVRTGDKVVIRERQ
jgi:transmembrane sensor